MSKKSDASPAAVAAFPFVGIGASAGGIESFTALLKALPDQPSLAIIFVLHQDPHHVSNLPQIIERVTKMKVETIRPGMAVQPAHVYLAPADAEVWLEGGVLQLRERPAGLPSVIDGFLRSLAEDQGPRAISVVLSGSGSDGVNGTRAVKSEGGITFAQDDTAKVDSMPRAAIASGCIDFVLSPHDIAEELLRIGRHEYIRHDGNERLPEKEVLRLLGIVRAKHDIDFTHYKPSTIERRIRRRMAVRKVNALHEYLQIVRNEPAEIEHLYSEMLIRVTGFFRDPDMFAALQRDIFPDLLSEHRGDDTVRVWVPGCATGEEVYSIAIALLEIVSKSGFSCPIQIFGTDISDEALEAARAGLYPEGIAGEMSAERLRRFFNRLDGGYRVSKGVRDCCIFARQNVTKDPPFSKLDLISCRNVMIYFGIALQKKVMGIFHYALRPNGFLVLGSSESVTNFGDLFSSVDRKNKIYRKNTVVPPPRTDFSMPAVETEPPHAMSSKEMATSNVLFREADHVLVSHLRPAGVLVNDNLDVLQFRGRTSAFLEIPPGSATFNLMKMVREGLLADLRAAIFEARKKQQPVRREGVRMETDGETRIVNIEVIPFVGGTRERFLLVLFEEPKPPKKTSRKSKEKKSAEPESRHVVRLKRELQATREYLQSIIEEQETMNEELRSANEEIQSSNEELQSTNEELETAKEELQSTNEELTTLNEELENRNVELANVNNDLMNVLVSVEIPIVMLDSKLRIRRFNPSAQQILNLIPSDLGRSLTDLKTSVRINDLQAIVNEVIERLEVREATVTDEEGRKFSMRVRPYRTTDNRIEGAVLAFINLGEFTKK